MKKAELYRVTDNGIETIGNFSVVLNEKVWKVFSLERPWKGNQHDISCIPCGTYICSLTKSAAFSIKEGKDVFTYQVMNVPMRAGIRIHSANYFNQLKGCIALGMELGDINKDGQTDVLHSVDAIKELYNIMQGESFQLTIHDISKA